MIRTLTAALSLALLTPAMAQDHQDHNSDHAADHGDHKGDHVGDHGGDHGGGHQDHADDDGHASMGHGHGADAAAALLSRTPEIDAALAEGGEPVVVDVLGVVCDFCAKAMNKTFSKREEVLAVYVDLDTKTLNLVLKDGAELADDEIDRLVKRAGYRIGKIRRGAAAIGSPS